MANDEADSSQDSPANSQPLIDTSHALRHSGAPPPSFTLLSTSMTRLATRTASSPETSIWRDIPEVVFRSHLVELEKRTNAVPLDAQVFPLPETGSKIAGKYVLPVHVEQQLADDFAFLSAVDEGAQSVAAACIEERASEGRITVRFASLDGVGGEGVVRALEEIGEALTVSSHPQDDSTPCPSRSEAQQRKNDQTTALFTHILHLHTLRLLARLRSQKWSKPKYLSKQHKKPLFRDFANLLHRVQFLYAKREAQNRRVVETLVEALSTIYTNFETTAPSSSDEFDALKELVSASYDFCLDVRIREFVERLERSVSNSTPTSQVASTIKTVRQIEKIGAYLRIAKALVETSRAYPELFRRKPGLEFLTPYQPVPTEIAYEEWAKSCHVHAEVTMVVFYELRAQRTRDEGEGERKEPRVMGTSKYHCYLCYLFLKHQGRFPPVNTHGRLYDQWTIPDLEEYGMEVRERMREVVRKVDAEVVRETVDLGGGEAEVRWRAEPMTSRQNLLLWEEGGGV
ncbi:hypothetical protein M011DRAFT_447261 [Sporormia fimetaria CBS 119925]|uniref:Uncharacterized protein n=1 Tax=Sporormia fimetaria CBS 119925 TaxID=1340428 RepID=A0A6A6V6Y2_9PLEO|nr:hypothetical protein M011DRAFT_447261 [Sporormia fimetaria CBS 119925]